MTEKDLYLPLEKLVSSTFNNVVVCEQKGDNKSEIFYRYEDKITTQTIDFFPFLLLSTTYCLENFFEDYEVIALNGDEYFKYLIKFNDIKSYKSALKHLKKVTGFPPSSVNAPYKIISDIQQQILIQSGIRLFRNMKFSDVRRMQFDIETLTTEGFDFPNPKREEDKIIIISLSDNTGWEKVISIDKNTDEKKILELFVQLVQERDPDVLEGHNIFRFDLPFIEERAKRHKVKLTLGRDNSKINSRTSLFNAAERSIRYTRYDIYGRHTIDTYLLVQLYDISHRNIENYGLKSVAKHFGVAAKNRTYIDASNISEYFEKDKETTLAYALDDVRDTKAISEILSPSFFYQTQIIPFSYQNAVVRGNATKIDSILLDSYLNIKESIPRPDPPQKISGGLTGAEKTGTFKNVWHCDIRSLYPSIILSRNLVPEKDKKEKFTYFLKTLKEFRLEAKDKEKYAKSSELRDYFNSLQSTFKIIINSFYGYLGFSRGIFNDYNLAEQVTSKGREVLNSMLEFLDNRGANIIEMDTDGIFFQPPDDINSTYKMQMMLQEILPKGIEVELDMTYPAMFCYKAKNYALLSDNNEVIITGAALKSRGVEPYIRKYLKDFITLLLNGRASEIEEMTETYYKSIENREIPLEHLAKTETLNDSLDKYKSKLNEGTGKRNAAYELALKSKKVYRQGDQISYYVTGNKARVSVVDNCKLLQDATAERDENIRYYKKKLEDIYKKFKNFLPENDRG